MSNLLRTIQQVTRDYVDSISHRLPSIKNGAVTATSSDGTATVRVDGDTATTGSVPSIAVVKTGDRVKMILFNRQLTILGAIQRTDKLVADTLAPSEYLSDGTDLNNETVPGIYAMSGSHTYANNPVPGMWGFLEVTANATGVIERQVASRTNRTRYERWYTSGSWTAWEQMAVARPFDADTLGGVAPSGYQAAITDSGWVSIALGSDYYNSYAYVRKVGNVVYLRGRISSADGSPLEAGWKPGVIPAGYRPSITSVVMCGGVNATDNASFFKVSVDASSGIITILANLTTNGSSSVYFDGLSWMVD